MKYKYETKYPPPYYILHTSSNDIFDIITQKACLIFFLNVYLQNILQR
jgi:hypothetical protein